MIATEQKEGLSPIYRSKDSAQETATPVYHHPEKHFSPLFLCIPLFFGVIIGSIYLSFDHHSALDTLDLFFCSSVSGRLHGSAFSVLLASAASSFLFLAASFLCGLTMWGRGAETLLSFIRGFGLGMTAGFLYSCGMSGIWCYILIVLPGTTFHTAAFLETASEGLLFSRRLVRFCKTGNPIHQIPPSVSFFAARAGIFSFLALLGALTDLLTKLLFAGWFQNLVK